jgi:hypothetical protein
VYCWGLVSAGRFVATRLAAKAGLFASEKVKKKNVKNDKMFRTTLIAVITIIRIHLK